MHFLTVRLFLACVVGGCSSCRILRNFSGYHVGISGNSYMVQVYGNDIYRCAAVVIDRRWVLTAANCVAGPSVEDAKDFTIRIGSSWHGFGTIHNVSKLVPHKSYDHITGDYDIALVKVKEPFPIDGTKVSAIALPKRGSTPVAGTKLFLCGWDEFIPYLLKTTDVLVISKAECETLHKKTIHKRMICAESKYLHGYKKLPYGDRGTQLVDGGVVIGVFAPTYSSNTDLPGVYSNVGYFRNWIKSKAGI